MGIFFLGRWDWFVWVGVPVVLEQKTTILWKSLYLLASLKDSPGLGGVYETNRRGGEENPVHGRNTTVNVDVIRSFHPPYVWTKPIVFLLTLDRESTDRCFLYACYGNPFTLTGFLALTRGAVLYIVVF